MKKNRILYLIVICAVGFLSGMGRPSFAQEPAARPEDSVIAQGRELFNSKEGLGVKYACISCHKGDKVIKKSMVAKLGDKLPSSINKYITGKAKGEKALEADSAEMEALMAYIRYEHAK